MYRTLTAIAVLVILTASVTVRNSVFAQSADDPSPAEQESTTEAQTEAETSEAESAEVFIPTEEISEDFAVSFPVDI